jgi:hypothetical protein
MHYNLARVPKASLQFDKAESLFKEVLEGEVGWVKMGESKKNIVPPSTVFWTPFLQASYID